MKKLLLLLLVSSACAQVVIGGGRYITGNPGNVGPTLSSIAITPSGTSTLAAGATLNFSALGHYSDASTQDLTAGCLWASSNLAVLALGTQGVNPMLATGLKAGSSTVNCSYAGVTSNSDVVTVSAPTLQSIEVAPATGNLAIIAVGTTTNFTATGSYSDGSSRDLTASGTWHTSDATKASLGTAGSPQPINGVAAGTSNITCVSGAITSNSVAVTVVQVNITTTLLPQGQVSQSYSAPLNVSGGTAPYIWAISSGSLPPGLFIDSSTGTISGMPTSSAGSPFAFTVLVTDFNSFTGTASLSITITTAPPPPLMISSGPPPNGQTTVAYSFPPTVVGGVSPYSWSALATNLGTFTQLSGNNTSACGPIGFPSAGCYGATPAFATTSTNTAAQTQTPEPLPGQMSSLPIQNLLFSGFTGEVYCELQPWFSHGSFGHPDIGMDMHNAAQILAILNKMASVGCTVVWVDYYAPSVDSGFDDTTTNLIAAQLATGTPNLKLNILYDQGSFSAICPQGATDQTTCITTRINADLDSLNTRFFGQSYYTKSSLKPVVTYFVTESLWSGTNWTTVWANVRTHTNAYASGGIKNVFRFGSFDHTQSDGEYAWVQPPTYSNGSPNSQLCWDDIVGGACNFSTGVGGGVSYLNTFYTAARLHPTQLAIGGLWPGFDWSNASYNGGIQKIIQRGCGQLPSLTAAKIAANGYGSSSQIYGVGIDTWNDYGEGTGVEPGIDNCVGPITATLATNTLSWTTAPTDATYYTTATIKEWDVLYTDTLFVQPLRMAVGGLSAATTSQDLSGRIPPGTWAVCLQMIGQPLILNKFSNCLTYTSAAGQVLPTGLSIASTTGIISGTPTTVGTWPFTLQVQDSQSTKATQSDVIAITAGTPTLKITSAALPGGTVSTSYSFNPIATGGVTPYTWSVIPSTGLPNGLSISSSTGLVTGTPTTAGTFVFTLQVKDNAGTLATQAESVVIQASSTTFGPPAYLGSNTSTLEVNTPVSPFNSTTLKNAIGYDISLNPSGSGITGIDPIVRVTDPSNGAGPCWETWSGGANDVSVNSNSTLLGVMCNNSGTQTILAFNPATMQVTGVDSQTIGGTVAFTRTTPLLAYRISNAGTIFKEVFTISSGGVPSHVETQLFNITTQCAPTSGKTATATFYATIDTKDTILYSGIFSSGGDFAVAYRIADGKCSTWQPSTGAITDFNGNSLTTSTCTYSAHDGQMSKNGVWGMVSAVSGTSCLGQTKAFWQIGTSNVVACVGNSCQGHESWGFEDITVINNPNYTFRDPAIGTVTTFATQTASINETHFSTDFVLPDDSQAVIAATGAPNATPWPGSLYDEVFAVKRNGQFVRFTHTWGSWASPYFRVSQGIGVESQDGRFFAFTSDMSNGNLTACALGKDNAGNCRSDVFIVRLD